MDNYIKNIYEDLKKDYEVGTWEKGLTLKYQNRDLLIYDNGQTILLIENLKCLHHVPKMLSSTDFFFIQHIRTNYPTIKNKKGQLSIFDFI